MKWVYNQKNQHHNNKYPSLALGCEDKHQPKTTVYNTSTRTALNNRSKQALN